MLTEKNFDTGTVAIHYVEGPPSGKPLVLLHRNPKSHREGSNGLIASFPAD